MILTDIFKIELIGGVAGGLTVIVFFSICYANKIQIGKGKRMGLNFKKTACTKCGAALPRFRRPANLRQILWGGWSCHECGSEYDKWMKPIDESKSGK